jgi:MinD superfamily P-loop ATPase
LSLKDQVMIFPELCHSCFACSELCPFGALPMEDRNIGTMDTWDLGQLHFLEGRLNIGEEQAVPLIAQTLKKAQEDFANIIWKIFDAPPGTSCPVIEATRQADLVILVTEPTPFGLHDLTLAVETMKKLNRKVLVVINRYEGPYSPLEEYCSKEGLTILARIPYSLEIAQVYSKGELLYPHIPQVEKVLEGIYQVLKQTEDQG